jgi:hypothetical protein
MIKSKMPRKQAIRGAEAWDRLDSSKNCADHWCDAIGNPMEDYWQVQ